MLVNILCYLAFLLQLTAAKRSLIASSLVTCKENSAISANSFNVVFNPDDSSIHYALDLVTELSGVLHAEIDVYAYGFKIITESVDFCNLNWKQFCPIYPGDVQINSIEYISKDYVDRIPGIAYQVPDIDAYARLRIYDKDENYLACIQIFFSNGKTVSQAGVKWATAVVAGIGLLLSAVLSTFGNSTAASHISANTMSLFLYFQSVVVVTMMHVHYVPPIAAAWSENLAWSMGLIRVSFMQKIFRWYVQATGGDPVLYLTSTTISVLTQRSVEYLKKRTVNILYGNANTLIFRGIKRLAYNIGIENTSVVCTGFTFFVICGYILAGFVLAWKYGFELCIRAGWIHNDKFIGFRHNWKSILKGSLLRYIYIGFTQLTILSFWEFTQHDSGAVIVIACLFIILSVGLMAWAAYRTNFFARKSIEMHNNPAAILYGDDQVLTKYGFFYTMFNAKHYWWNSVMLSYSLVKALFIGFAQSSGKTQALVIFILELCYFAAVVHYKPYLDRPTNLVNILISTVTLVNSFLFLFFSDLFGQPYSVNAIMGWIFFILNAAFSFLLLMMILTFTGMIIFSKNPDLRFKPANDDRTSFQQLGKNDGTHPHQNVANELAALSVVARDHTENWEYDLAGKDSITNVVDGIAKDLSNESESNHRRTKSSNFFRKLSMKKLKGRNDKSVSPSNPVTNLSKDDLTSPLNSTSEDTAIRNAYPGHIRQQSDSQNGLISSVNNEHNDEFKISEPNIFESSSSVNSFQRNHSFDSIPHQDDITRKSDIF